jgi:serine/threonine protein kinase
MLRKIFNMFELDPYILSATDYSIVRVENLQKVLQPKLLGSGEFANIYKGRFNGCEVAIKQSVIGGRYNQDLVINVFLHEEFIFKKIEARRKAEPNNQDHAYIVQYFGTHTLYQQTTIQKTLVLEFANQGDLHAKLNDNNFTWAMRYQILKHIAQALRFLHTLNPPVVHGDIKTENILLSQTNGELQGKICDFGLSKEATERDPSGQIIGSPIYLDPQTLDGESRGIEVDVWALGLMLWELFEKKMAYHNAGLTCFNDLYYRAVIQKLPHVISQPDQATLQTEVKLAVASLALQSESIPENETIPTAAPLFEQIENIVKEKTEQVEKAQRQAKKASLIVQACTLFARKDRPKASELVDVLSKPADEISPQLTRLIK